MAVVVTRKQSGLSSFGKNQQRRGVRLDIVDILEFQF